MSVSRSVRSITGTTQVAAVIGSPVTHSLSPALHNAAFAAAGANWVYTAFEVAPGSAAAAVSAMRTLGLGGLSVTMPHKEDIAAALDELDPAAEALRSVNTVVRLPDGRLRGCSTDGAGFVASLVEAGVDPQGRNVAVVGAGAAARAVIDALARVGASSITVINRSSDRAREAAALAGARGHVGSPLSVRDAEVVVNATSVGMGTDEIPFDVALLHSDHVVADLVYHPLRTALLRAGERVGARTVDGLGMLVHQAALQQELWLGVRPDPSVMRAAAIDELEQRASGRAGAGRG